MRTGLSLQLTFCRVATLSRFHTLIARDRDRQPAELLLAPVLRRLVPHVVADVHVRHLLGQRERHLLRVGVVRHVTPAGSPNALRMSCSLDPLNRIRACGVPICCGTVMITPSTYSTPLSLRPLRRGAGLLRRAGRQVDQLLDVLGEQRLLDLIGGQARDDDVCFERFFRRGNTFGVRQRPSASGSTPSPHSPRRRGPWRAHYPSGRGRARSRFLDLRHAAMLGLPLIKATSTYYFVRYPPFGKDPG